LADQIYLFYSDEELLIQERIKELKRGLSDQSLSLEQIDADEPNMEQIISALTTQPLLFSERLLIIRNADLKANVWEQIIPALQNLSSGIRVIIWARSVNRRTRIFKAIDKIGEVCEFRSFADWEQEQVASWIARRAKALDKNMTRATALRLQEISGNNLLKLSSEIEKLITYVGSRKQITDEDVIALASPGQISIFALSDAVSNKNLPQALSAWRNLLKNKVQIIPLLSMLANRFRIMLMAKEEKNQAKIAQALATSPYYVKKCSAQASRFTRAELKKDLAMLLETDLKLKSGEQQQPVFELLLTSLCGS